jgi:hypothetical protein
MRTHAIPNTALDAAPAKRAMRIGMHTHRPGRVPGLSLQTTKLARLHAAARCINGPLLITVGEGHRREGHLNAEGPAPGVARGAASVSQTTADCYPAVAPLAPPQILFYCSSMCILRPSRPPADDGWRQTSHLWGAG